MKTIEISKTLRSYVDVPDDWEWDGSMRRILQADELPVWVTLFGVDTAVEVPA